MFLTLCFPVIIKAGRKWLTGHPDEERSKTTPSVTVRETGDSEDNESTPLLGSGTSSSQPTETAFDLWFLTASFFADATLTAGAGFCRNGTDLYLGMYH